MVSLDILQRSNLFINTPTSADDALSWIQVIPGIPYFQDEQENPWTPIGHNDAITWPGLQGLFKRRNKTQVELYLRNLKAHGITCIRMMLEYNQGEGRYFEKPVGRFQPAMVQLWDDLFNLCEIIGLRILLTPFDTFWMWRRWQFHPYNRKNGGPCSKKSDWFSCPNTLEAIQNRLAFATNRWGGSGVLFAWDLYNEASPIFSRNSLNLLSASINKLSIGLKSLEVKLYGKSHLQTVSVFSPHLEKFAGLDHFVFKNANLDFATLHLYDEGINYPKNTIDGASKTRQWVEFSLASIADCRPFLDTEHGPINTFKRKRILKENFDNEYYKNIQWAHFASGGAGGGMRWPYRHPHVLTEGMRKEQKKLSDFSKLINWRNFKRKNISRHIHVSRKEILVCACGDERQAIVWLLNNTNTRKKKKELDDKRLKLVLPEMEGGKYQVIIWDTVEGKILNHLLFIQPSKEVMKLQLIAPEKDLAVAVKKIEKEL